MMAIVLYTVDGANNINLFGVEEVAILKWKDLSIFRCT
jgi:hypothetical protein